jgi:antitoxin VapB
VALSIKDPEADRLARALASATGETLTKAVTQALRERLERVAGRRASNSLAEELNEIALRCAALPDLDTRTPDEIIGYDEHGLPR